VYRYHDDLVTVLRSSELLASCTTMMSPFTPYIRTRIRAAVIRSASYTRAVIGPYMNYYIAIDSGLKIRRAPKHGALDEPPRFSNIIMLTLLVGCSYIKYVFLRRHDRGLLRSDVFHLSLF